MDGKRCNSLSSLFNLSLSTDAKHMAIEKLKAHKKTSAVEGEVDLEHQPVQNLEADIDDIVGDAEEDAAPLEEDIDGDVPVPEKDLSKLLKLLNRTDMIDLAKQPGQGRREAAQNMRAFSEAFGEPQFGLWTSRR